MQYKSTVDVLSATVSGLEKVEAPVLVDRQLQDLLSEQGSLVEVSHC